MKFFKSVSLGLVFHITNSLLVFTTNIVVTRVLGPEGKGLYALLVTWSGLILMIFNFGLGQSAIFYIGQKRQTLQAIASTLLTVSFLIGIPASLGIAACLSVGELSSFRELENWIPALICIYLPFALARLYAGHLFAALHDFFWYNLSFCLEIAIRLIFLCTVLFLGLKIIGVAFAIVFSTVVAAIIAWARIKKYTIILRYQCDISVLKQLFPYGIRSSGTNLISLLNLRFDQVIVAFLLGVKQVGFYSAAVALAEISTVLAKAASSVLFAKVSSLEAAKANQLTGKIARITLLLGTLIMICFSCSSSYLIRFIFGPEFQEAETAFLFLLPGVVIFNLHQIFASDLAGRGKPELGFFATFLSFVTTLLGDFIFIPLWGINGAALASSFAYMVSSFFIIQCYRRVSEQSFSAFLLPTKEDLIIVGEATYNLLIPSQLKNKLPRSEDEHSHTQL